MKKRITLLFALAFTLLFQWTHAASGGPDAYGYTWKDSNEPGGPTYTWFPHNAPGAVQVSGLGDDNSVGMFNMFWDFHFYWGDYNSFKVGSNGWVSLQNVSNIAHCFPTIPTSGGAGDLFLAPLMSDLTFTSGFPSFPNVGQVWYWTNQKDSLFVSYVNTPWWQSGTPDWYGSNTFQIFLDGSDSSITYRYQTMSANFQDNFGCNSDIVIGIENQTGSIGLQCFATEVTPASSYAIKFRYPTTVLINVPDVSPLWNTNAENGGVFFPTGLIPALQSNIKNVGNVPLTNNTANVGRLRNLATTVVYTSTFNLPSMAVGADSLIVFNPQATVTTPGQYYWEVTATNISDINAANNTRTSEIGMVNMSGPTAQLTYCTGGTNTGSISWSGGALDDGVGVYQIPPIYPISINSIEYFVASNASETMIASVYDDNGPNGTAGTLLWTTTVPAVQIVSGAWNTVTLPSPLQITSGGYYVAWFMGGPSITIGTETNGPISRRSFEILGGNWASYRDNTLQDFLIKVNVGSYPCAITAGFSYTSNATTLQFTNGTTGGTSYAWDFGDGATSTSISPSHTYATTGTYTICLISTNSCGSDTSCQQILVSCPAPTASFSYLNTGTTAAFTDLSTGGVTSWLWDFGDGSTSTSQNPTHTYALQGTYTACLITTGQCGADTTCGIVNVCIVPNASYLSSPNGLTVTFNNLTSGASTYAWNFGDGTTSTAQNPTHTFPNAGFYLVCLTASSPCATDSICLTLEVCAGPSAAFTSSTNQLAASFTNTTVGTATYQWTFGDGGTATQASPSHTYAIGGTYTVCLIATDSCASDTACQQVTVAFVGIDGPDHGLELNTWPNPVEHQLNAETNLPIGQAGNLSIVDLTGRKLQQLIVEGGKQTSTFDLSTFAQGMYFLQLESAGNRRSIAVIKQ